MVSTVKVAVTTPIQRYASVVFDAGEFGLGTCDVGTVQLIRAVLTVVVSVTYPNLLNTLSVAARELVVSTCFVALLLVGAIRTVWITVAHPCQRDALAFGLAASELISVAHSFLTYFWVFVATVFAICFVIALPVKRYTVSVFTLKFVFRTCDVCHSCFAHVRLLVSVITAIVIPIARPR